jgi:hypothetical protein
MEAYVQKKPKNLTLDFLWTFVAQLKNEVDELRSQNHAVEAVESSVFTLGERRLSPILQKAVLEARERATREKKDPAYRAETEATLSRVQAGPPLFGGIGADEFMRKCRDEWNV